MSEQEVCEIPLGDIAWDPRPERQIRPLNQEWVERLMETDPSTWDPIVVRAWPASDPYPAGQEGRRWQGISGYHRSAAGNAMRLPTLRGRIVTADSDVEFLIVAWAGNMRHGLQMRKDEQITVLRRLRDAGLSEGDIASRIGLPRGTVHNWLTSRDTNAARSLRDAADSLRTDAPAEPESAWHVTPTANPSTALLRHIGQIVSDFLASTPHGEKPADVLAYIQSKTIGARRSQTQDVDETIIWLSAYRAGLLDGIEEVTRE